jgi:hypothetical protein
MAVQSRICKLFLKVGDNDRTWQYVGLILESCYERIRLTNEEPLLIQEKYTAMIQADESVVHVLFSALTSFSYVEFLEIQLQKTRVFHSCGRIREVTLEDQSQYGQNPEQNVLRVEIGLVDHLHIQLLTDDLMADLGIAL